MKNKFKLERRAKNPRPNILGCGYGARPNIDGSGWAARPNTFLKCFGSGWPATPNAITPFEGVLGLAVKLEPGNLQLLTEKATPPGMRAANLLAWVCSQAHLSSPSAQSMAAPTPGVCSPTKIKTNHFLFIHPFNAKCIPIKRQPHPPLTVFPTPCGKGSFAITLLQSTVLCI